MQRSPQRNGSWRRHYFTIATEAKLLATSSTSRQTCDRHLALRLWLLLYILGGPELFFDFHEHVACLHDEFDAVLGCTAVPSFLATSRGHRLEGAIARFWAPAVVDTHKPPMDHVLGHAHAGDGHRRGAHREMLSGKPRHSRPEARQSGTISHGRAMPTMPPSSDSPSESRRVLKGGPAIGVDGRTCGERLYCGNHTPKA